VAEVRTEEANCSHDIEGSVAYNPEMHFSHFALRTFATLAALACLNVSAKDPKPAFQWQPERSKSGPILVIVNLDDQLAFVYRNGIQIGQTPVSTGRHGFATPTGVFSILGKDADHHSNKYHNASMPYAERLTWSGVFLHAGSLPGYPSSHGCVHLPLTFAKNLYQITSAHDTTVLITQSTSQPSDSAAPVEQLLGIAQAEVSREQPGDGIVWQPDKSEDGSVAIVISGADKRIEILRGGILIGQAPASFTDPNSLLPEAIYLKLAPVPGKPSPDWSTVVIATAQKADAPQILSQLQLPPAIDSELKKLIVPGTLLITTQGSLSPDKRSSTDFVAMQANAAPPASP
jgi:hypothetical protein